MQFKGHLMKNKQNSSIRASALQITFRVTLISLSAALLTLAAAPARKQIEQKPAGAGMALQSAHRRAAVSESSAAPKRTNARKSARVEISASRQRVGGHEIAGFSARQAPDGAGGKPDTAGRAQAGRAGSVAGDGAAAGASGGMELASFYPARYGEPFVVEGEGVRVAVRPVGGTDVTAQIDNGQVIYREAYPETDSVHVVSAGRSEEFLFLQSECAPREFAYELSEAERRDARQIGEGRSALYQQGRARGEDRSAVADRSHRRAARGSGALGAGGEVESGALQRLRLVVAKGLSYPVMIDPSWVTTGSLGTARYAHTATLLPSGKVLVAGGLVIVVS